VARTKKYYESLMIYKLMIYSILEYKLKTLKKQFNNTVVIQVKDLNTLVIFDYYKIYKNSNQKVTYSIHLFQ